MKANIAKPEVAVKDLMRGNKNVVLLHDERRYALTITRRGKLILTADESKPVAKISIRNTL